ncbi:nucleotidyl transferase AbiEii/AbiGii toxin family protein [Kribbella amoyensis]|uniref:nucleotidyl transferase AbiEii/AbiGii toxin family protein n=1 Tax=Kribbella amoyensis TaxID=996641 RepID=UPI001478BEBA|nr:nucleotidyl transferase AbiEii/AbiGii toxin family protein [Kribbella amoyensis]
MTDQLRMLAQDGRWRLGDLQRQYAYDQLVERLYRLDSKWVIKGATALLARRVSVRHTIDIDIYRPGQIVDVERMVREAAALDIADWMRFEVAQSRPVQAAGAEAARVGLRSFIGTKLWAAFQVDLVADGVVMIGEPDEVHPLTALNVGDREHTLWRAYPLVDHVADKVCAILETHGGRPSTRYKDLIDLVAITQQSSVPADLQRRAFVKEARRRTLTLPKSFDVPDVELWTRGYRSEARRTVGLQAVELEDALKLVKPFVDPLLAGPVAGRWVPENRSWELVD